VHPGKLIWVLPRHKKICHPTPLVYAALVLWPWKTAS
jgi:hypothetical protein